MSTNKPTAIILAGGKGSRLGGVDKGLLQINGRSLVELCIDNIRSQAGAIVINANRHLPAYRQLTHIVVPDATPDYSGPLSGILSVMDYLELHQQMNSGDVLTVPCDMPLLPSDLVERLYRARSDTHNGEPLVVAHDGRRLQPLCTLLPWTAKSRLEAFIKSGHRKALDWIRHDNALIADFSDETSRFINVNTDQDVVSVSEQINRHD